MPRRATLLLTALFLIAFTFQPGSPRAEEKKNDQISYRDEIAPLLKKYCTDCHGGERPRAKFALDTIKTDADASKARREWHKVVQMLQSREMPPANKPQPTAEERVKLIRFLDQQLAAVDCMKERNPGRVTIRRLNRYEYNRTIRDLIGVNFKPGDDFPSDDSGYGFDNIGDVLSLPPILMEKYLAAAERIVNLALGRSRPRTLTTIQGKRFGAYGKVTTLADDSRALYPEASVRRSQYFRESRDVTLHFKVYAEGLNKGAVHLVVKLNRQELGRFKVTGTKAKPQTFTVEGSIRRGNGSLEVHFPEKRMKDDPRRLVLQTVEVRSKAVPVMPKVYDRIMTTRPSGKQSRVEAAKKILLPFARRAFRRPVKPEEIERYLKLVKLAESQGDSFDKGVGLAIQAILVSPHFLFLVEKDPDENDKDGIRQLSEHELATRLSYFLWSTMPDEELFQLAEKGELRKNLKAQIKRMLKDKRSHSLVESFGGQWLQLRNLKSHDPDPDTFPKYSTQLRADMIKETEMFFETIIKEDRSILDFIDADFTFLNRRLAGHYGMWRAVRSRGFQRVSLAKDSPRGGILTMGSILTVTSNPTRTSPVKRGKWILENLLNAAPPPPPPDAGELEEGKKLEEAASLRKRLEMHRSKPSCAICHARMDPLGFALENFDGVGSWRWKDGNHNIDARADLPTGEKFKGPSELKKVLLKRKDQFARCLAEKMLTYAMGRGTDYYDRCAVDEIVKAMKKNNYRFSTMIEKIVESEPFQLRKR